MQKMSFDLYLIDIQINRKVFYDRNDNFQIINIQYISDL